VITTLRTERWFPRFADSPAVLARLYCLPHAGAGATTYQPWPSRLPAAVAAVPVQLAGREARFSEPAARSAAEVVAALTEPMLEHFHDLDGGFALFGHSMGALLSYELAHELTRRGRPPAHLFVSGYAAPHLPPRDDAVHLLPDAELCAHIAELAGTPAGVLEVPELMRAMLPTVRADFEICEAYRHVDRPPLPIPITALGGTEDPGASPRELEAWQELTEKDFTLHCFSGGHFYLLDHSEAVIDLVAARLLYSITEGNGT
jgi:surfactin synthase thioesterase subunit